MSAESQALWPTIIGSITVIILAIIKWKPSGFSRSTGKSNDLAVAETKITHIEEHLERLEKTVLDLEKGNITHNLEIDVINGIIEEIRKEVKDLK